jgi:type I restriction enzyme M protein
MSEGQKGGEFFTPTSVVRFIVEVIEPYAGKIFDPACGSGGMFVQSAKFIQEAKHDVNDIYVHGQEFMGETARLAKMNLMVNNIRGEVTEGNSYEIDPYNSIDKFDFVMANPPFNVKSVRESTVKNDERFYKYGLPKNKGKNTNDSITDANYLWISLFATSLNEKGRAGFVMANSASDAGNSEYDIRKKIVDSGMVDCMVSMPANMFFTVTLPATLWFFDKQKINSDRKDKILFIDARTTYHQIDRAHREWKEEQIQNLATIVHLFRGESERYLELVGKYVQYADKAIKEIPFSFDALQTKLQTGLINLRQYAHDSKAKRKSEAQRELDRSDLLKNLKELTFPALSLPKMDWNNEAPINNVEQKAFGEKLAIFVNEIKALDASIKQNKDVLIELWNEADKLLKLKMDKNWGELELNNFYKRIDELYQNWKTAGENIVYWHENMHWLQSRFPQSEYVDVIGLCKVADKKEYGDDQDYSLNAGRYVGVEIDGDDLTKEQFAGSILEKRNLLVKLNNKDYQVSKEIENQLLILLNELE